MLVVSPMNNSLGSTPETLKREKLEREHAKLFILWALKKARSPWGKNRILDAYEEYVESLGANRTQRRIITNRMDFPIRHAIMDLKHDNFINEPSPHYWTYVLTESGKKKAKELKVLQLPPSLEEELKNHERRSRH